MKILLPGASGLVGAEVARQAATAGHVVIGLVGRWTAAVPGTTELHSVNFIDPASAGDWVKRIQPDAIVNAAAISEPAACEVDPVVSQALNVTLPATLAKAAASIHARFIHISSEQVFDGENAPYSIDHPPYPLNLYGRQKVESEQRVQSADATAASVRAPLLLGNSLSGRRSVHEKLFELWSGNGIVKLYLDEYRQVCSAGNLASALLELASRPDLRGVFHWAGAEVCSRYELGLRLASRFNVSSTYVAPVRRTDTPAVSAKRPANLALDLAPLSRELRIKPQTLDEALQKLAVPEAFREWQRKLSPVNQA